MDGEAPDAVILIKFDEIHPAECRVSDLGFEHKPEERRLASRDVPEKVSVSKLIARLLDRSKGCSHRLLPDDRIISGGVEHYDVISKLLCGSFQVTSPGSGEESLGCVH